MDSYAVLMGTKMMMTLYCRPAGTTYGQIVDIFIGRVASDPSKLDEEATIVVLDALNKAFPCKSEN